MTTNWRRAGSLISASRRITVAFSSNRWLVRLDCRLFSGTASTWLSTPHTTAPPHTEHVEVPCASSGHVMVSLHDIDRHPPTTPVILNLPAFPTSDITNIASYLPSFLHRYPTATIHYRWPLSGQPPPQNNPASSSPIDPSKRLYWPAPIHDTLAAYDHLVDYLAPQPRPLYLYGSYLGATLATSLALTESHTDNPIAVRGLIALNGIYNWTTFLPDHPLQQRKQKGSTTTRENDDNVNDDDLAYMRKHMPRLFQRPADLFDPFASPVLFFHTPGLLVPPGFADRWRPSGAAPDQVDAYDYVYSDPQDPLPPTPYQAQSEIDEVRSSISSSSSSSSLDDESFFQQEEEDEAMVMAPQARKGYFTFPPRNSTLEIPEALFLHSSSQSPAMPVGNRKDAAAWRRARNVENNYAMQAMSLAGLMRRSVEKREWRENKKQWAGYDDGISDLEGEISRRVGLGDVGVVEVGEIGETGHELAALWLEERVG